MTASLKSCRTIPKKAVPADHIPLKLKTSGGAEQHGLHPSVNTAKHQQNQSGNNGRGRDGIRKESNLT